MMIDYPKRKRERGRRKDTPYGLEQFRAIWINSRWLRFVTHLSDPCSLKTLFSPLRTQDLSRGWNNKRQTHLPGKYQSLLVTTFPMKTMICPHTIQSCVVWNYVDQYVLIQTVICVFTLESPASWWMAPNTTILQYTWISVLVAVEKKPELVAN